MNTYMSQAIRRNRNRNMDFDSPGEYYVLVFHGGIAFHVSIFPNKNICYDINHFKYNQVKNQRNFREKYTKIKVQLGYKLYALSSPNICTS